MGPWRTSLEDRRERAWRHILKSEESWVASCLPFMILPNTMAKTQSSAPQITPFLGADPGQLASWLPPYHR